MTTTVLIADDHPDALLLLRLILESFGCTVICANNGAEAVELVKQTLPNIAFMDLSMPVMDGFDAIKELKTIFDNSVPVYALSAHCRQDQLKAKALAMGAEECICKPIDMDAILATLARHHLVPDQ